MVNETVGQIKHVLKIKFKKNKKKIEKTDVIKRKLKPHGFKNLTLSIIAKQTTQKRFSHLSVKGVLF